MPWRTKVNPLENDGDIVARTIVEANSSQVEQKIEELEKRIDVKNKAFFESLQREMRSMIAGITPSVAAPSFASVAARAMGPPPPPAPTQDRGRPGRDLNHGRAHGFNRDRSTSVSKRARVDDDAHVHAGGAGLYSGDQPDHGRDGQAGHRRSQSHTKKYDIWII